MWPSESRRRARACAFSTHSPGAIHVRTTGRRVHEDLPGFDQAKEMRTQPETEVERGYRHLIDSAPLAVLSIDLLGNIVQLNRVPVPFPVNPKGQASSEANVLTSPVFDRSGIAEAIRRCLASGEPSVSDHSLTLEDRATGHIRLHLSPTHNPDGEISGALAMVEDTTERRRLEERMRHRDRLGALGQLAGGVAHDFNNILTGIILSAHTLLGHPGLEVDMVPDIQTIISEAERAGRLVRQILDFSRQSVLEVRPIDLSPVIHEAFELLRRTLPANIRLVLELGADRYLVNADASRIQEVLTNLALNAQTAMPDGGELRIALTTQTFRPGREPPVDEMAAGDWVCLSVSDTGVGMSPQVAAHLFEPFFTTRPVGEGSGLGLAQVHGIVTQHQGYIDVETELGDGTTFRIFLPLRPSKQGGQNDQVGSLAVASMTRPTVLMAEDDATVRKLGCRAVEALGHRVLTATNGVEALDAYLSADSIDLVVADMVMPEMGGRELMHELRSVDPTIKGVLVTGYAVGDDLHALREEGIVDVIRKPFSTKRLAEAVQSALGQR